MNVHLSEFHIIEKYFSSLTLERDDVTLGIGDDCALLQPPAGKSLAVSMDTLVSGRHFFADVDPESLGHKALAVNLSDLAAMGAEPAWVTLALTLPEVDESWLHGFAKGFATLAKKHHLQLIGGDTTHGPLSITIQAHGFVDQDKALRRDGAAVNELIYVTGTLGDAALALQNREADQQRLLRPEPCVAQGLALAEIASAAIDISDGLLADLGHICTASSVGASINCAKLPLSEMMQSHVKDTGDWQKVLAGGDDYELCFMLPKSAQQEMERLFAENHWPVTLIGETIHGNKVRALLPDGSEYKLSTGFDHFDQQM